MEYYMKENKKGYSNNEEDQEEEFEEDTHHHTSKYSSPCYNYGSSSSSSKNLEAINFMDLSLRNGKEDDKSNNGWPPKSEMEHMFDKVVTPSDVGKLNRLVIPKQHAEKYFPLDSSANEKGLLLNFRDRAGKPWRFRYSYWNSSQSYVMTKGWSRFVKDKKLDPGDIVSFIRSAKDSNVMYIDWRRRLSPPQNTIMANLASFWGGRGRFAVPHFRVNPYQFHRQHYHHGTISPGVVIDSVPLVQHHQCQQGKTIKSPGNKRLRLFGVNMECSSSSIATTTVQEEDEVECQILSSRVAKLPPHYHHLASSSSSSLISQQQQPMELKVPNLLLSEKGKPNSLSFYLDP